MVGGRFGLTFPNLHLGRDTGALSQFPRSTFFLRVLPLGLGPGKGVDSRLCQSIHVVPPSPHHPGGLWLLEGRKSRSGRLQILPNLLLMPSFLRPESVRVLLGMLTT